MRQAIAPNGMHGGSGSGSGHGGEAGYIRRSRSFHFVLGVGLHRHTEHRLARRTSSSSRQKAGRRFVYACYR